MILIDNQQILESFEGKSVVDALRKAFLDPPSVPPRMHHDLPGDDGAKLLIMPSWADRSWIGVKVATVIPSNPARGRPTVDGSYLLMDGGSGELLATLSAQALTVIRTAGVSALAASLLARKNARHLLMIGTGALAPHIVRFHCAMLPIERVVIWGRSTQKAEYVREMLHDLPIDVQVGSDLPDEIGHADIISSATFASAPLIEGAWVAPGTHVDLIGSFTPSMREADSELFRRGRLVVDTQTAFEESGDLTIPVGEGAIHRPVPDLSALLRNPACVRQDDREITIFKSVGTGLADLAAAVYVMERLKCSWDSGHRAPVNL